MFARTMLSAHRLRDDRWLQDELEYLWATFFADTPRVNTVRIEFAGPWKIRLGVISLSRDSTTTFIGINSLLRYPEVPYYIASITVAHELVHYAHGFGSPLPRRYPYPHRGGIVERELRQRGLEAELLLYKEWIDEHWFPFYARKIAQGSSQRIPA